jgi:hypothetical protein
METKRAWACRKHVFDNDGVIDEFHKSLEKKCVLCEESLFSSDVHPAFLCAACSKKIQDRECCLCGTKEEIYPAFLCITHDHLCAQCGQPYLGISK